MFRRNGKGLVACDRVHGEVIVASGPLSIGAHAGATYRPKRPGAAYEADPAWGVYDSDGAAIPEAAYRRGPGPLRVGGTDRIAPGEEAAREAEGAYLYAGPIHVHYGHFVLSAMARLWPYLERGRRALAGRRILYHGDEEPAQWLARPHAAAVAASLGLGAGDFVRFLEPVRLPDLLVPEPSCEETHLIHPAHVRLARSVADALLGPPGDAGGRPAYLAKTGLPVGVWRFVNEDLLAERLERAGVEVVRPETLSFAEQIRLFETRPAILGTMGSALHTALFSRRPVRLLGLYWARDVLSNQLLIDRACGHAGTYLRPRRALRQLAAGGGFPLNLRLPDPVGTAEDLLRRLDE